MTSAHPLTNGTRATRQSPIFYYGTELPSRERARELRDVIVVLQPYHSLCMDGGFAEYFPLAWRFVYFNPTAAPPSLLTDSQGTIPTLGYDTTWDLMRLDLKCAVARRFAIAQGRFALQTDGVQGLFVDDLDLWDYPAGRRHAWSVLSAVAAIDTGQPAWFVNRGFGFWKKLHGLAAVLLEEISPYELDHLNAEELSWFIAVAMRAIRHAQTRGIAVYSLTYNPAAVDWQPRGVAATAIAAVTGKPLLASRHFDRWPSMLAEEKN